MEKNLKKELLIVSKNNHFDGSYFIDDKCVIQRNGIEFCLLYFDESNKNMMIEINKYNILEEAKAYDLESQMIDIWKEINNGYNPEEISREVQDCGDYIYIDERKVPYYKTLLSNELDVIVKFLHKPSILHKNEYYVNQEY